MRIKIDKEYYANFNDFSLASGLDRVASAFAFTANYDPNNPLHRQLFKPLSYKRVEFYNDDNVLFFTGTIVGHKFTSDKDVNLVSLSGYSLPGILEDCSIPYAAFPLESLKTNLKEITQKIISYFGLQLIIYKEAEQACSTAYKKTTAEPGQKVKDYLAKLAAQKNVILSHDRHGRVLYFKPDPNAQSKIFYTKENVLNMEIDVDGQSLHSDLTIVRQPEKNGDNEYLSLLPSSGSNSGSGITPVDSIKNPLVEQFRPTVQKLTSGRETDTKTGVENYLADELKNIRVKISLNRWDPIYSGDIIEIQNPEIFIFNRTRFMIEGTTINESASERTMSINAVLPESFEGKQPKKIFG